MSDCLLLDKLSSFASHVDFTSFEFHFYAATPSSLNQVPVIRIHSITCNNDSTSMLYEINIFTA